MKGPYIGRNAASAIGLAALMFSVSPARADYSVDFETLPGPEWSHSQTDRTPAGRRGFLGQFGNDEVVLWLDATDARAVTLSFDLLLLNSWDGNEASYGPDIWQVRVVDGPVLLRTTFSNVDEEDWEQSYPAGAGEARYPAYTGAVERDSLGATYYGDAVYRLTFTFQPPAPRFAIAFSAEGLQNLGDESWGLDNVKVEGAAARARDGGPIALRFVRQEPAGYVALEALTYADVFFLEAEFAEDPGDSERVAVVEWDGGTSNVAVRQTSTDPLIFRSGKLRLRRPGVNPNVQP